MPPVQVRAAGLAYVRSTRAWQLAENQRAPWKSAIFSGGWARGTSRSVVNLCTPYDLLLEGFLLVLRPRSTCNPVIVIVSNPRGWGNHGQGSTDPRVIERAAERTPATPMKV